MPSHPEKQQDSSPDNIERVFLGLPPNAQLPQVVGAREDWAKQMAQKVRRQAGDESVGVAIARIGRPVLKLPDEMHTDPGVDPVGENPVQAGQSGGATATVPHADVSYVDTEPVIVVTLDTSKLSSLPAWMGELAVRVVDRPDAQIIPSSYGLTGEPPDAPEFDPGNGGGNGSVFEASLGSATTFMLVAGGFGAAYWWFGPDGSSS